MHPAYAIHKKVKNCNIFRQHPPNLGIKATLKSLFRTYLQIFKILLIYL